MVQFLLFVHCDQFVGMEYFIIIIDEVVDTNVQKHAIKDSAIDREVVKTIGTHTPGHCSKDFPIPYSSLISGGWTTLEVYVHN